MSVQAEVRCHDQVSLQAPLVHACVKILELLVRKLLLLLLLVLHGRLPREVHAPVTIEQVFEPLRFVELPADGTRRSKILKDNVQPQYHVANACPTVITVGRNRLVQRNASDASIQQQERGEEKAARHEQPSRGHPEGDPRPRPILVHDPEAHQAHSEGHQQDDEQQQAPQPSFRCCRTCACFVGHHLGHRFQAKCCSKVIEAVPPSDFGAKFFAECARIWRHVSAEHVREQSQLWPVLLMHRKSEHC
mmetsp:Transcript_13632/g.36693  ORF Transcript_13632/g.36693 Transcript_13632/m.36693 type:complete len:248 (-) Transcript_13632:243-986(-)